jgi:hypothetical protein
MIGYKASHLFDYPFKHRFYGTNMPGRKFKNKRFELVVEKKLFVCEAAQDT